VQVTEIIFCPVKSEIINEYGKKRKEEEGDDKDWAVAVDKNCGRSLP
jgi:hypothetical protein